MANLRLTEEDVATERIVILEERRCRVDNDPSEHPARADDGGALCQPSLRHSRSSAGRMRLPRSTARMRSASTSASMRRTTRCSSSPAMSSRTTCGSSPRRPSASSSRNPRLDGRKRPQEPEHYAPVKVELEDPRAGPHDRAALLSHAELCHRRAGRSRGSRPADAHRRGRLGEQAL